MDKLIAEIENIDETPLLSAKSTDEGIKVSEVKSNTVAKKESDTTSELLKLPAKKAAKRGRSKKKRQVASVEIPADKSKTMLINGGEPKKNLGRV